ncbi:MAG: acetyltransferase [Burkholderiales bacterium]|nr:acetyltransferase [Burkholderiales bacterium]
MSSTDADQTRTASAFDVFNGDADGICALHQLRLAEPLDARLVTGVKRDICLLPQFTAGRGDRITVLDISLDANLAALQSQLAAGAQVEYFDHHSAAMAFSHPALKLHSDEAADVCTSILVNHHLQGRYAVWAIVAAFGDNLIAPARAMALTAAYSQRQSEQLQQLGTLLNYNAYGEHPEDLHFHPAQLYRALHAYRDPCDFIAAAPEFSILRRAYAQDLAGMETLQASAQSQTAAMYILPDLAWARRVSGMLANKLKNLETERSFAVLTPKTDGSFVVSVRSAYPQDKPASDFCSMFCSGGGRRAAAGINALPSDELTLFASKFFAYF